MENREEEVQPIIKLSKDLREAAAQLEPAEVRYLVDLYYIMQDGRIRADGQIRSMGKEDKEPHATIQWLSGNFRTLEGNVKRALEAYAAAQRQGAWALSNVGIGPVIAAGLLAHIDMDKTPTVSSLWSFAGLNPQQQRGGEKEWKVGQKRPWNARLKVICWHAGESFKRCSGNPKCVYGKLYRERKELEVTRSEAGQFAGVAEERLKSKLDKSTDAYKAYSKGKLPPGRLDLRATRYATKIFLSHFWAVSYEVKYGRKPENPWILEHGGHQHGIQIPNWPLSG